MSGRQRATEVASNMTPEEKEQIALAVLGLLHCLRRWQLTDSIEPAPAFLKPSRRFR